MLLVGVRRRRAFGCLLTKIRRAGDKNLEQIRKQEHAENNSDIIEIDDLFVYLAEQDKLRDLETDKLKRQNEELASVTENQTAEIDKRQAEIERLAYSRKTKSIRTTTRRSKPG